MAKKITVEKRNETIKDLVLKMTPVKAIARRYKIHPNTVRLIISNFVASGELIRVPNTSPAIYTDPHPRVSLTNGEEGKTVTNDGSVNSYGPLLDSLPSTGLPVGWVNHHISGYISMTVRKTGTFDEVPWGQGYCGYWEDPTSGGRGQTLHRCNLRLWGQDIVVAYYESVHGKKQFRVHPGRIYVDPEIVTLNKSRDLLIERAQYIAGVLKATGWQLTDPEIKGVMHTAKDRDPLTKIIPADRNNSGDDIIVDNSPGYPEAEMEHAVSDEEVRIFANIPSAIIGVRADVKANADAIAANAASIESVNSEVRVLCSNLLDLREAVVLQSSVLTTLSNNVSILAESQAKLVTMGTSQIQNRVSAFTGEGYQ